MTQTQFPSPAFNEKALTPDSTPGTQHQVLLRWSAPSHFDHERSHRWYLVCGILVLATAGYSLLVGAWTFTLALLLLGGVYFLTRKETAPNKTIQIEKDGVQFEQNFTQWTQCKDFWLIETPLYTELHITRRSGIQREISIQTGNIDLTLIRSTLSQFLSMRPDQKERFLDAVIRICKL